MKKTKNKFDIFFQNDDLTEKETYSLQIVKSTVRSVLEPLASDNYQSTVLYHFKNIDDTKSLIKRLEYSSFVDLIEFSDFQFSKYDIEELGFVVISSERYNCAFLFKEIEEDKYSIYFKLNSKFVNNVYETVKSMFNVDYDEEFYKFKPERRENNLMNRAVQNILKDFRETINENECNLKLQENYKNVNTVNASFRNELYQNIRQIAHEIKNQLSILDIYTRILEKKTGDSSSVEPVKKSVLLIKKQIDLFKDIDAVNLQEKDIKEILKEAIKNYSELLKEKNNKPVLIDEMPETEARAFVDGDKFLIVINNIIKNAHDSTHDDEITIKLSKSDSKAVISFINHGEMIKKENQSKIFEQGYTTKKDGWGVGLSVCKKYIGSQFGTFELTKSDKKETVFTVSIPLIKI